MGRKRNSSRRKAGLPPGTPVYTGGTEDRPIRLTAFDFDAAGVVRHDAIAPETCQALAADSSKNSWITVDGVHDVALVQELSRRFGLHPLVVEDIVNVHQRPKLETFGDYLFIVLRSLDYDDASERVTSDQVSIVLGRGYVLVFQERPSPLFDVLAARLLEASSRLRERGPDYLTYRLADVIIDHYFVVLERLGDRIEELEEAVEKNADREKIGEIMDLRRDLAQLRRTIWPVRDVMSWLDRSETPLIQPETRLFLRDLQDHALRVIEILEAERDMIAAVHDLHLNVVNLRLNEVMKFLAVITTVFLPMSFLAGVWGMNFHFMPELDLRFAYPIALAVILGAGLGMLLWFRARKWI